MVWDVLLVTGCACMALAGLIGLVVQAWTRKQHRRHRRLYGGRP